MVSSELEALQSPSHQAAGLRRYDVLRRLSLSPRKEVLLARVHGPLDFTRIVVIKRPVPHAHAAEVARGMAREAVAYARLDHSAIVRLHDFIADRQGVALVLEYVDGLTLQSLFDHLRERGERLDTASAGFLTARIFEALAAAHGARDVASGAPAPVIHRDVTPSHVLIPWSGDAKLASFGLAKVHGLPGDTQRGSMKGTPGFMTPEQVLGDRVTPSTDVYQACLVAYELFSGRPAFAREELPRLELLHAMVEGKIFPLELARRDVPGAVADALRRGTHSDSAERSLSPDVMVRLLRAELDLERGRLALQAHLERIAEAPDSRTVPRAAVRLEVDDWELAVLASRRTSPPSGRRSAVNLRSLFGAADAEPVTEDDDTVRYATEAPTVRPPLFNPPEEAVPPGLRGARERVAAAKEPVAASAREAAQPTSPAAWRPRPPPRSRRAIFVAGLFLVLGAAAACGAWFAREVARGRRPPSWWPRSAALASGPGAKAPPALVPSSPSSPSSGEPPSADPASGAPASGPSLGPTRGALEAPREAAGHRVFADGRLVCTTGMRCVLPCGHHRVRLGSAGREQIVDIPCGGSIAIDR